MNDTFAERYFDFCNTISLEAFAYLEKTVKDKIQLIPLSDIEDRTDAFYNLPICESTDKYGFLVQYSIVSVTKEDNVLWFNGKGRDEDALEYCFGSSEVYTENICLIADLVINIQNHGDNQRKEI